MEVRTDMLTLEEVYRAGGMKEGDCRVRSRASGITTLTPDPQTGLSWYDRQRDVRRMGRVVEHPLVRHHEDRVPLVVAARVQVPVVLGEQGRGDAHPQPVPGLEH